MSALTSLAFVFRILMLSLLMGGVLAKPVIVFAGELHEAGHVQSTGEDGHFQADGSEPADPSDVTNPWHALMHFSHCCGHAPALLPLMYLGCFTPVSTELLSQLSVEFQPAVHPVAFRPPISA